MPIVKVGEPEPVGELQDGDKLRHAFSTEPELTPACHRLQKLFSRIVGLEVVFRIFRVN